MAFENVASSFIGLAPDQCDPKRIPAHYAAYYNRANAMFRRFRHFGGVPEIPHNFWPLVCLLAEAEERITELEKRLVEVQGVGVQCGVAGTEALPQQQPSLRDSGQAIDRRTREGRAMRTQQLSGAGA